MKQVTITDPIKPDREASSFGEADRGSPEAEAEQRRAKRWGTNLDFVLDTYRRFADERLAELNAEISDWADEQKRHNRDEFDALRRRHCDTRAVRGLLKMIEERRSKRYWKLAILTAIDLGIKASEAKIRPHVELKLISNESRAKNAASKANKARRKTSRDHDTKFKPLYQKRVDELMTSQRELTYTAACKQTANEFRSKDGSNRHHGKKVRELTKKYSKKDTR